MILVDLSVAGVASRSGPSSFMLLNRWRVEVRNVWRLILRHGADQLVISAMTSSPDNVRPILVTCNDT